MKGLLVLLMLVASTASAAAAPACDLRGLEQKLEDARAYYIDLMGQPDNPQFRTRALAMSSAFGAAEDCRRLLAGKSQAGDASPVHQSANAQNPR